MFDCNAPFVPVNVRHFAWFNKQKEQGVGPKMFIMRMSKEMMTKDRFGKVMI